MFKPHTSQFLFPFKNTAYSVIHLAKQNKLISSCYYAIQNLYVNKKEYSNPNTSFTEFLKMEIFLLITNCCKSMTTTWTKEYLFPLFSLHVNAQPQQRISFNLYNQPFNTLKGKCVVVIPPHFSVEEGLRTYDNLQTRLSLDMVILSSYLVL